jgi:hypothetical protein
MPLFKGEPYKAIDFNLGHSEMPKAECTLSAPKTPNPEPLDSAKHTSKGLKDSFAKATTSRLPSLTWRGGKDTLSGTMK